MSVQKLYINLLEEEEFRLKKHNSQIDGKIARRHTAA